jgi:hypothetical protein
VISVFRSSRTGRVNPWPGAVLALGGAVMMVIMSGVAGVSPASAQSSQAPVGLGTAGSFAVLAGSTVTNTGPSVISGDVGVSPGSAITGFPPGIVVNGVFHAADAVAAQAQADLTTAYNDAAGRSPVTAVGPELGGQTLPPGVYGGGTLELTGTLTLDAEGDPEAVFIFQAASTLITASSSAVDLINGADPCNVFWQVGSSATLGTDTDFVGTVMALTSITAETRATVEGRLLARNGAVTLDTNTITRPECGPTTPPTTPPVIPPIVIPPIIPGIPPITVPGIPIPPIVVPPTAPPGGGDEDDDNGDDDGDDGGDNGGDGGDGDGDGGDNGGDGGDGDGDGGDGDGDGGDGDGDDNDNGDGDGDGDDNGDDNGDGDGDDNGDDNGDGDGDGGDGDNGDNGGGPAGGDQVSVRPRGGVDTGDGSGSAGGYVIAGIALTAAAGAGFAAHRAQRQRAGRHQA